MWPQASISLLLITSAIWTIKSYRKETLRQCRLTETCFSLLYAAFEKHKYYYVKDLAGLTRQPSVYLKEILNKTGVQVFEM